MAPFSWLSTTNLPQACSADTALSLPKVNSTKVNTSSSTFDESSQLVLYPEEASADHFGLIGTTLQTDYSVGFNAIRERCNGLLNCVWKRSE